MDHFDNYLFGLISKPTLFNLINGVALFKLPEGNLANYASL